MELAPESQGLRRSARRLASMAALERHKMAEQRLRGANSIIEDEVITGSPEFI